MRKTVNNFVFCSPHILQFCLLAAVKKKESRLSVTGVPACLPACLPAYLSLSLPVCLSVSGSLCIPRLKANSPFL